MRIESRSDPTRRTGPHRRSRASGPRLAALGVCAILLAACSGGGPTTAPTAAPTATPIPTATPFDVGAAFLAIVKGPDFAARIDLDGTFQMGVNAVMTGSIEGGPDGSRQTMTVSFGSTKTTTESVRVGEKGWSRTLPGPWLAVPTGTNSSFSKWLAGLSMLEDLGLETKDGVSLHHLRPVGGSKLPPEALGFDPKQFSNADISIEIYAKDDGTPALFVMSGSWVQKVNNVDINVTLAIDMTISQVGQTVTVTAPTDVWTPYKSDLGYSAAHPAAFTVVSDPTGDTYRSHGVDWFYVVPYAEGEGLSAEGFRDAILESYASNPGDPRKAPVVVSLGGEKAYRAVFDFKAKDGTDLVLIDVLAVHGDLGWEVSLVTTPSDEAADTKIFDAFLAAFKFTK